MARRGHARGLAVALFLALLGSRALADDRANAQEQVKQGLAQYEAGEFAAAAASLEKAYTVLAEPRLLFNIARAYERAGERAKAASYYERYLQQQGTEPELQERARQGLERVREPAPATTAPPASAASTALPPTAAASSAGGHPVPAPTERSTGDQPSYTLPTALMVVGGAAAATGIGFGFWASSTASDARGTTDPVNKPALRDAAQGRAAAADILLAAGILTFGTGLVLRLFVLPPSRSARAASPRSPLRGRPAIARALGGTF